MYEIILENLMILSVYCMRCLYFIYTASSSMHAWFGDGTHLHVHVHVHWENVSVEVHYNKRTIYIIIMIKINRDIECAGWRETCTSTCLTFG